MARAKKAPAANGKRRLTQAQLDAELQVGTVDMDAVEIVEPNDEPAPAA